MKRNTLEAVLFLPAMVLLAGAVFGVFWLVMKAGNAAVYGWHALFRMLGLPFPVAMALTVIAAALTVYGLAYWLGNLRRRKAGRRV
jgi:membrane protein implicated in regulation of membrane protease activity